MVIKYRQIALDKLASPDELDQLPRLVSPRTWFAGVVILLLVIGVVVWGYVGCIPVKVDAMGTFLTLSGITPVESLYSGELKEILVKTGDEVQAGQMVATLRQTDLEEQIDDDLEKLNNLINQHHDKKQFGEENLGTQQQKRYLDKLNYKMEWEINKQYLIWLKEKRDNQKALWEKGLDTKGAYIEAKTNYKNALNKNKQIQANLKQLIVENTQNENQLKQDLNDMERSIREQKLNVEQKQEKLRRERCVRSSCQGRVINISVDSGRMLNPGDEILRVERKNERADELIVKLYVASNDGPKVNPGMNVVVTPFSIETGEYGDICGFVSHVSSYTSNSEAMQRVLQNELLVQNLTAEGAPYEVTVCLLPDPATVNGLKWTTKKGAPVDIKGGTLCSASVTVENKRPAEFVMPFIRKKIFGIEKKNWVKDDDD
ncbi:MAG: NHLP bacteriocin system secretion protein [Deltaproteobacteria bacterium]|nr:NHLP bacteriocin system secretion protein [Deltaproteobacteria bacterium]